MAELLHAAVIAVGLANEMPGTAEGGYTPPRVRQLSFCAWRTGIWV